MSNGYFDKNELQMGRIVTVNPPNLSRGTLNDSPLFVDAFPYDYHAFKLGMTFAMPFGMIRLPRKYQSILIEHLHGVSQNPIGFLHAFNMAGSDSGAADPLPLDGPNGNQIFVYQDDFVIYHDETYAYTRFRNAYRSNNSGLPDGGPALWETKMRSGSRLAIQEYTPPGYPQSSGPAPSPVRAKFSLTMPSGAAVVIDEPAQGQATVNVTTPSGATVVIDSAGVITVTAPHKMVLNAPDVELGQDGGQKLAYKSDVQNVVNYLNSHTHTGVAVGSQDSGAPSSAAPNPIGTTRTNAT